VCERIFKDGPRLREIDISIERSGFQIYEKKIKMGSTRKNMLS